MAGTLTKHMLTITRRSVRSSIVASFRGRGEVPDAIRVFHAGNGLVLRFLGSGGGRLEHTLESNWGEKIALFTGRDISMDQSPPPFRGPFAALGLLWFDLNSALLYRLTGGVRDRSQRRSRVHGGRLFTPGRQVPGRWVWSGALFRLIGDRRSQLGRSLGGTRGLRRGRLPFHKMTGPRNLFINRRWRRGDRATRGNRNATRRVL